MLTNGILEAQVSLVPPAIFLSGIPEMKHNRADSKCPPHLHSHYTSFYRLQVFPKYLKSILTFAYALRSIASGNVISVCWIYLYKGNCNNDNNGLQKEWHKSVNKLIKYFKEIKSLTEGEWAGTYHGDTDGIVKLTHQHADDSGRQQQQDEWVFKLETKRKRKKIRKIDCMEAQCFSEFIVSHISRWRSEFICLWVWSRIINVSYTWQQQISTSLL